MIRTKNSSSTKCVLPTLGDRPADGLGSSPLGRPSRKQRLSRKALVATVAGLLVLGGATTALAATFNDTAGTPFEVDIAWMATHGIAGGFNDGGYHPTAPVSRQAMASFMHKYNQSIEVVTKNWSFSNSSATSVSVICPSGKRAIAGGATTNQALMYLTQSEPGPGYWYARFVNDQTGAPLAGTGKAYAVCIPNN